MPFALASNNTGQCHYTAPKTMPDPYASSIRPDSNNFGSFYASIKESFTDPDVISKATLNINELGRATESMPKSLAEVPAIRDYGASRYADRSTALKFVSNFLSLRQTCPDLKQSLQVEKQEIKYSSGEKDDKFVLSLHDPDSGELMTRFAMTGESVKSKGLLEGQFQNLKEEFHDKKPTKPMRQEMQKLTQNLLDSLPDSSILSVGSLSSISSSEMGSLPSELEYADLFMRTESLSSTMTEYEIEKENSAIKDFLCGALEVATRTCKGLAAITAGLLLGVMGALVIPFDRVEGRSIILEEAKLAFEFIYKLMTTSLSESPSYFNDGNIHINERLHEFHNEQRLNALELLI